MKVERIFMMNEISGLDSLGEIYMLDHRKDLRTTKDLAYKSLLSPGERMSSLVLRICMISL